MLAIVFDYDISEQIKEIILSTFTPDSNNVFTSNFPDMELSENYALPPEIKRCIYITNLDKGIRKSHTNFINANKNVLSWTISVINIWQENLKDQLISQIDTMFAESDSLYEVIFDEENSLIKTKEICLKPIKEKKLFLVLSKNMSVAEKASEYIKNVLVNWDVKVDDSGENDICSYADAIAIVGEQAEDFCITSMQKKIKNRFVWLNKDICSSTKEELQELTETVENVLSENKWGFSETTKKLFVSTVRNEKYYQKFVSGEITEIGLKNDNEFVMWDKYGLPFLPEKYTKENIQNFFETECKFSKILNDLKNRMEK